MKKLVLASIFAILSLPAFGGETLDRVMKNKLVVEVTDQAYPPFSYIDENGTVVGFDIDVAQEMAKRLGVGIKVETPAFEIISSGKWQGRWDVCVCSMTPTAERRERLDFPVQYYAAPAVIVVHAGNKTITGAKDLDNKRVGVEAGTTYERYVEKQLKLDGAIVEFPFAAAQTKPYQNEDAAFEDLGLGDGVRLDAIIANNVTAREHVRKAPDKFKIVGETLFAEPIWVSTEKGDAEWNAKIAQVIRQMAADGTLKSLSEKWTGIDISTKP